MPIPYSGEKLPMTRYTDMILNETSGLPEKVYSCFNREPTLKYLKIIFYPAFYIIFYYSKEKCST